jgi:hypothetical protein
MRKSTICICAFAVSILLVGGFADDGFASASQQKERKGDGLTFAAPAVKNAFTVSGMFTGSLQGKIRVGNREIVITKQTRIFKTGKGLVDYGTLVTGLPIHVSARVGGKDARATSVIITSVRRGGDDGSSQTGTVGPEDSH